MAGETAGTMLGKLTAPVGPRPEIAKTPIRAMRISEELWGSSSATAAENGETVTDVVRRALIEYVADRDSDPV